VKLVVITGCLGLIGSYVTRACLAEGWKVYGIDKCTYAANINFIKAFKGDPNFTFLKEDIVDLKHLPDCDYVINLAAESHVGNSILNSEEFIRTNILGVKNLLDLVRKKPSSDVDQPIFFQFSTDEVYGDIITGEHSEEDKLCPSNPYSASKASADMFILSWARTYGTKYIILRPTNNYGIGQYHEKLIPASVRALFRGRKLKLHDAGEPYRNWLHSEDTAMAVIKIIKSKKLNEIYNVAGNFEQQNKETFRKIVECYFDDKNERWKDYVDLEHKRQGQDVRYALDDLKLKALGWKPNKVFDDELKEVVNFYKKNFRW
jgi:dTDP-glucose 4,6-dehydratase